MAEKVVGLRGRPVPRPGEVNPELVAMLRDTLAMAETGQLQTLMATGFTSDGMRFSLLEDARVTDIHQMTGAIEWLKFEFQQRVLDRRDME